MTITVVRDGREARITAPAGVLNVEGDLDPDHAAEVRTLFTDLGDSAFASMTVSYGTASAEGKASPRPFSDLWLAVVALNELPERGYRVGIVAEAVS